MTDDRTHNGQTQSPSLSEAIDRLADELDEIHRHESGTLVEYVRSATVFAVRQGTIVSFRLRPESSRGRASNARHRPFLSRTGLDHAPAAGRGRLRAGPCAGLVRERLAAGRPSSPDDRPPPPRPN
jgi:hypothetical protein